MWKYGFILMFVFSVTKLNAQRCTATGQTPSSAIFLCGSGTYVQTQVGQCGSIHVPTPCQDGSVHQDKNPTWFRFACYIPGTIGFTITPNDPSDNYDWQLFDMTSRNPVDVLTDPNLFLACNWSNGAGETGASADGTSLIVCSNPGEPPFSSMPTLQQGHEYLLLVSNFTNSINGFQFGLTDGTASITDPVLPKLQYARLNCNGTHVIAKLNRMILCNTLSPDGSEFSISPAGSITSATVFSCTNGDFDSVALNLASPLPNGNYTLTINDGTDGNTLMDHCSRYIPTGNSVPFNVSAFQPTPLDSVRVAVCKASEIQVIFQRPIQCNSIVNDGSDFIVNGPQTVSITNVINNCGSGTLTYSIKLKLASPIMTGGNYQLRLKIGSDGNTIIDECGLATPAGSAVNFITNDAASAAFNYTMQVGCKKDTLQFQHSGGQGINTWSWKFDNNNTSSLQNPIMIFAATSTHTVQLIVTNGICIDTASQTIALTNGVTASFEAPNTICPGDSAILINKTTGTVNTWNWNFGNGNSSTVRDPGIVNFIPNGNETFYTIQLTAIGNLGCRDSVSQQVRVLSNCNIAVPNAFTPNNDGLNDYLYPLNASNVDKLDFKIFNRNGQLIFYSKNWQKKWDGTMNGFPQPAGIYIWILSYTHRDTKLKYTLKGTAMLIR